MSNTSAIVAGIVFVALSAANVVVMLEASQPSRNGATRSRLITAHRTGGYLFVILFCIMAYDMSQRLAGLGITSHREPPEFESRNRIPRLPINRQT
jgi:hypothetical protein